MGGVSITVVAVHSMAERSESIAISHCVTKLFQMMNCLDRVEI